MPRCSTTIEESSKTLKALPLFLFTGELRGQTLFEMIENLTFDNLLEYRSSQDEEKRYSKQHEQFSFWYSTLMTIITTKTAIGSMHPGISESHDSPGSPDATVRDKQYRVTLK